MDERTRQLVQGFLDKAHLAAFQTVQARIGSLPEEDRQGVQRAIEAFRECLQQLYEATLLPDEAHERMTTLIFGHADADIVHVMRDYAHAVEELLIESKRELLAPVKKKEN
jgi:hypothetical protein